MFVSQYWKNNNPWNRKSISTKTRVANPTPFPSTAQNAKDQPQPFKRHWSGADPSLSSDGWIHLPLTFLSGASAPVLTVLTPLAGAYRPLARICVEPMLLVFDTQWHQSPAEALFSRLIYWIPCQMPASRLPSHLPHKAGRRFGRRQPREHTTIKCQVEAPPTILTDDIPSSLPYCGLSICLLLLIRIIILSSFLNFGLLNFWAVLPTPREQLKS